MTFLIQQTLIYTIPLMIVALAGVFAERSGIINIALDGIMIFGSFVGALAVYMMQTGITLRQARTLQFYHSPSLCPAKRTAIQLSRKR